MVDGHCETTELVPAPPAALFAHFDHLDRLSGETSKSRLMSGSTRVQTDPDELGGSGVGARLRLSGRFCGVDLYAREVVTLYEPPYRKSWATIGDVHLLVIASYRMGFNISPEGSASRVRFFIDYSWPTQPVLRLLGRLLAGRCARWCMRCLLSEARAFRLPAEREHEQLTA